MRTYLRSETPKQVCRVKGETESAHRRSLIVRNEVDCLIGGIVEVSTVVNLGENIRLTRTIRNEVLFQALINC